MNVEEILFNLKLSKEQIIIGYDNNGTLVKTSSMEENVRDILNSYLREKDELVWLFNHPTRIKYMDEQYIYEQISFLEKRNHNAPYDIAWRIIFHDILNKRRIEKINKILNNVKC